MTVSSGSWTDGVELNVGLYGNGVWNLTNSGTVSVGAGGSGVLTMGFKSTGVSTLNLGFGVTACTLKAAEVNGGAGTTVVNFNHTGSYAFTPALIGSLSVNKLGGGTTTLSTVNNYIGGTTVNGGTLHLTDIGTQTFNGLTTILMVLPSPLIKSVSLISTPPSAKRSVYLLIR